MDSAGIKELATTCRQSGAMAMAVTIRQALYRQTKLPETEIEQIIQHGLQNYTAELNGAPEGKV